MFQIIFTFVIISTYPAITSASPAGLLYTSEQSCREAGEAFVEAYEAEGYGEVSFACVEGLAR
jgi:hypothetical protein